MKHSVITFVLVVFVSLFTYIVGKDKGSSEERSKHFYYKSEASLRYLEIYGSPITSKEQYQLDYIIWNDDSLKTLIK